MTTTERVTDPRNPVPAPMPVTSMHWQGTGDPAQRHPGLSRQRRRLNPVTVGFWLGGFVLGTAGAVTGAGMPYRHPVAVTLSILWWGLYLGCLGASIGAVLVLWKSRTSIGKERNG